ncbi:Stress response protein nst1 [Entophlyctis sp. JEL0112]|nr:Stress response protein nst1 [Entophlyctis sp. JEL0112]
MASEPSATIVVTAPSASILPEAPDAVVPTVQVGRTAAVSSKLTSESQPHELLQHRQPQAQQKLLPRKKVSGSSLTSAPAPDPPMRSAPHSPSESPRWAAKSINSPFSDTATVSSGPQSQTHVACTCGAQQQQFAQAAKPIRDSSVDNDQQQPSKSPEKKKSKQKQKATAAKSDTTAAGSQSLKSLSSTGADIWYRSDAEEKLRIREFWLELGEIERRNLVKQEKESVMKKIRDQQKHACSCPTCGKKKTLIEEELELLYDAYYEELENFAQIQSGQLAANSSQILAKSSNNPYSKVIEPSSHHYCSNHRQPNLSQKRADYNCASNAEDFEDSDAYDSRTHNRDVRNRHTNPNLTARSSIFEFGTGLSVQDGGILTVAEDFLKNDGRKFLELMDQLAERKIRLLEEEEASLPNDIPSLQSTQQNMGKPHSQISPQRYEDYEEDVDDVDDIEDDLQDEEDGDDDDYDEEDDVDEEDEEDALTEEQRMEEGRRMFQIFAAKMFEQRVLTAYREKVAFERQNRLLQELEEEKALRDQKEEAKQKLKEKKKAQKLALKQKLEDERMQKERERLAEEEALRKQKEKKAAEDRAKRDMERSKREAERLKKEEAERVRREAERLKKEEALRKQKEAEERKQKAREENERIERENRERKEREKEAAKLRSQKLREDAEAKAKAAALEEDNRIRVEEEAKAAAAAAVAAATAEAAANAAAAAAAAMARAQQLQMIPPATQVRQQMGLPNVNESSQIHQHPAAVHPHTLQQHQQQMAALAMNSFSVLNGKSYPQHGMIPVNAGVFHPPLDGMNSGMQNFVWSGATQPFIGQQSQVHAQNLHSERMRRGITSVSVGFAPTPPSSSISPDIEGVNPSLVRQSSAFAAQKSGVRPAPIGRPSMLSFSSGSSVDASPVLAPFSGFGSLSSHDASKKSTASSSFENMRSFAEFVDPQFGSQQGNPSQVLGAAIQSHSLFSGPAGPEHFPQNSPSLQGQLFARASDSLKLSFDWEPGNFPLTPSIRANARLRDKGSFGQKLGSQALFEGSTKNPPGSQNMINHPPPLNQSSPLMGLLDDRSNTTSSRNGQSTQASQLPTTNGFGVIGQPSIYAFHGFKR